MKLGTWGAQGWINFICHRATRSFTQGSALKGLHGPGKKGLPRFTDPKTKAQERSGTLPRSQRQHEFPSFVRLDVQCNGHTGSSQGTSQISASPAAVSCSLPNIVSVTSAVILCTHMTTRSSLWYETFIYLNWGHRNSQLMDVEKHSHRRTCKISKHHMERPLGTKEHTEPSSVGPRAGYSHH